MKRKSVLNKSLNQERREQEMRDTVYYVDSKPKGKNGSFHWNIGNPRGSSVGKS